MEVISLLKTNTFFGWSIIPNIITKKWGYCVLLSSQQMSGQDTRLKSEDSASNTDRHLFYNLFSRKVVLKKMYCGKSQLCLQNCKKLLTGLETPKSFTYLKQHAAILCIVNHQQLHLGKMSLGAKNVGKRGVDIQGDLR